MSKQPRNLMDAALSMAREYTDVPDLFVRSSLYGVSSFLFAKYVRATAFPSKHGFANLYIILSSPAGAFRRSTILDMIDDLCRFCFAEVNGENSVEQYESRKIEEFTKEGIADAFEATGFKDFMFMSSELGTILLEATRDTSYLRSMITIFSKLFYGEGWKQLLSARGGKKSFRIIPRGIYTTMVSLMQEVELYLKKIMVRQGFMRRVMVMPLTQEHLDLNKYKPLLEPMRSSVRDKFEGLGKGEFADRERELIKLQERISQGFAGSQRINMEFDPIVLKKLNEYDKSLLSEFKNSKGVAHLKALANLSQAEILARLCVQEALLDDQLHLVAGQSIRVTETHFERARQFHMQVMKLWDEALDRILRKEEKEVQLESYTEVLEKVYSVGKRNGGLLTIPMVQDHYDTIGLKNYNSLVEVFALGVRKGLWKPANKRVGNQWDRGDLTEKELKSVKPIGGGHMPQVFRLKKQ